MHSANHHGRRFVQRSTSRPTLTKREVALIVLICKPEEPTIAQIAALWERSPKTVGRHLENVYGKLRVHTRIELLFKAVELGLIKCPCESYHATPHPLAGPWEDLGQAFM